MGADYVRTTMNPKEVTITLLRPLSERRLPAVGKIVYLPHDHAKVQRGDLVSVAVKIFAVRLPPMAGPQTTAVVLGALQ